MARQRQVTRTIKGEKVTALIVHPETRETVEVNLVLTETYTKDTKKVAAIQEQIDLEYPGAKFAAILSSEPMKKRYAMPEKEFIANATEI